MAGGGEGVRQVTCHWADNHEYEMVGGDYERVDEDA